MNERAIGKLEGKMDSMLYMQGELSKDVKALHRRVDVHGRWIAGVKAIIAFVIFAAGYTWWWVKQNVRH